MLCFFVSSLLADMARALIVTLKTVLMRITQNRSLNETQISQTVKMIVQKRRGSYRSSE